MSAEELDDVCIVLHGREGDDGNYGDAEVHQVFRDRETADAYVSAIEQASEMDNTVGVWWVEKWPVQVELSDE